jgi:hypothetical protein
MNPSPPMSLIRLVNGYRCSQALYVVAKLGIADEIGDGAKSAEELATSTKTHPVALRRLLRMLVTAGVFEEQPQGRFRLTDVGALLRRDSPQSMWPVVMFFTGEETWRSWGALLHSVRTGEPAFDQVYGMNAFDYYARFPERERSKVHEDVMAVMTAQSNAALMSAYDFSQFDTLVDVGGGNGALLAALLQTHPKLRGILFDLPHAVAASGEVLRKAGIADRCTAISGSFFESVPEAGDGYVMKRIIHDWDDERAASILRCCRRAMSAEAKLLVLDEVLPERAQPADAPSFMIDIEMLVVAPGGRERTEPEFRDLFASADLRLNRVVPTGFMRFAVLEAVPVTSSTREGTASSA